MAVAYRKKYGENPQGSEGRRAGGKDLGAGSWQAWVGDLALLPAWAKGPVVAFLPSLYVLAVKWAVTLMVAAPNTQAVQAGAS